MLFVAYSLVKFKPKNFTFQKALVLPILLYVLMALSLFWSIDFKESLHALSKEIAFVLLPLCFLINPLLTKAEKDKILCYFSYAYFGYTIFYLIKAVFRYSITKDSSVFFYHELVTFDVNAIHMSVYISVAFFYFFIKKEKSILAKLAIALLLFFLVLLSSKNIIIVFLGLLFFASFFISKTQWNANKILLLFLSFFVFGFVFYGKLKDRFLLEIISNTTENTNTQAPGLVHNVSVFDAWNKEQFQTNDFFAGTALRVYQARIFKEMLYTDKVYVTGYGLNATNQKIKQKRIEHHLYEGYDKFNFHNQYLQFFAELGIFGVLLFLLIVLINIKNTIKSKNFVAITFGILMISLFLTESLLSRQRGIVFFVMLYCVFNSKTHSIIDKKTNNQV
jgi:O-antigen ligase